MNKKVVFLTGLGTVLLTMSLFAIPSKANTSSSDVNKLVDLMENAIDNYQDVRANVEVDQFSAQTSRMEHFSYQMLISAKDGEFGGKQEIKSTTGETTIEISDGKQLLRLNKTTNQYVLHKINQPAEKKERLKAPREEYSEKLKKKIYRFRENPAMLSGHAESMLFPQSEAFLIKHAKHVEVSGTETIAGLPTTKITASDFKESNVNFNSMNVWIHPQTGIILKRETMNNDSKTESVEITSISLNQGVDTAEFKIAIPENAQRVQ